MNRPFAQPRIPDVAFNSEFLNVYKKHYRMKMLGLVNDVL